MQGLALDLRFALRQLRKAPGFTLTAVLTLGLGLGVTTAVFSLVEGVLLRPLLFTQPERLVLVGDHIGAGRNIPVTAREIGTYSSASSAFSSFGGYADSTYELSGGAKPEQIRAARFTAGVFPTLGVSAIVGRVFTQREEDSHQPLAVISYALWLNRFNSDPHVVDKSIVLDRKAYTIIGVMPRSFEFPLQPGHLNQTQLWVPMSFTAEELSDAAAGFWGYHLLARLKDGVTVAQAGQDADRVARQIMRDFPASISAIHITGDVALLREYLVAGVRPLLQTLLLAVTVVTLIACMNVAGLLLIRAVRRNREWAVRLALGARAGAIMRESVLEGLLLSVAGGILGLAIAAIGIRMALHLLPESMPRINSISLDGTVTSFAVLLALASGILCSLAPAFASLRTNLLQNLKGSSQTGTGTATHSRLRSALVVAQIGIALVLLTISGMFLRSFEKMREVDPGFRPDHVMVAHYLLPANQYGTNDAIESFNRAVIERLSAKPGIMATGISNILPASGFSPQSAFTTEDESAGKWKLQFAGFALTDGDYFRAMGLRLLDGRTFTAADRQNAPLVIIVNQSMANQCWPGQRAIGKRLHIGSPQKILPWATVAGVVADTKLGARDEPSVAQWYAPAEQPAILTGADSSNGVTEPNGGYIVLRSSLPSEQLTKILQATVAEIDPLLALDHVQPMDDVIANVEAPRRFNTNLISLFAFAALLLATLGIYAVVAFSVSQRTHEIAIRAALGAQRGRIVQLVLISGAKLAIVGCCLGVVGSVAASRMVGSFLFQVSATDPIIYISCIALMMVVALLASMIPAVRAASADPIDALRSV